MSDKSSMNNGFDPRGAAANAVTWLTTMGYHAFNDNNNTDALTAIGPGWARDDAVFVVYGHGAPGQIAVEKNGVMGAIAADPGLGVVLDPGGVRANLSDKPVNYWNLMRLAVWIGCNTGVDADASQPYDWNLVQLATYRLGANSSLGFTHLIYAVPNALDFWSDKFFHALNDNGGTPATVAQASDAALSYVRFWWGTMNYSWGFADPFIIGPNVKINPAAYAPY